MPMQSLTAIAQQLDRRIKGIVRTFDVELLSREQRELLQKLKQACNEVKLDVRDYEYAQTRDEQLKWVKITRHNLRAQESIVLMLGDIFGPADIAELSAQIQLLQSKIE